MRYTLGIRREDKNKWEARVPLNPKHVKEFKDKNEIITIIQPSDIRIYSDDEYLKAGAIVKNDFHETSIIFAVKEIPIDLFEHGKTYVFFSHTVKGQKHNMPMLRKMIDLECNLIDYEKITDDNDRRLVFFGRFAGIAGMIDTLWSFSQKLESQNIINPFREIKPTVQYNGLNDIKSNIGAIGSKIRLNGIPKSLTPLVVGFAGYGNVSIGAQEILDILPCVEIQPKDLRNIYDNPSDRCIYKVVFKEEDIVEPISLNHKFELQDYYNYPDKYRSKFENYIPFLTILMNCIYWTSDYPRLITKDFIKNNYEKIKLQVIGDISIDINGAIEFTEKTTTPDSPSFVYFPKTDSIKDGVEGDGIIVMGIDNLPCELPKESSDAFSSALFDFVPSIVKADFSKNFEDIELPKEIKKAVILYHGKLTPDYSYIDKFL